jgi:hypothetical protein
VRDALELSSAAAVVALALAGAGACLAIGVYVGWHVSGVLLGWAGL